MTVAEILKIEQPQQLFNKDTIKKQYRKLALEWHPDKNGNENDGIVFQHIERLYEQGKELIKQDLWDAELNTIIFIADDKSKIRFSFKRKYPFELGEFFICQDKVVYFVEKEYERLVGNAIERLSKIYYASEVMENEFFKYIGQINKVDRLQNGLLLWCNRTDDLFLLRDVLDYFKGKLHPRHIGWIMSSLYNICCFLEYNNLVHNNISLDSYFVSPKYHSGVLYGWWYAAEIDRSLVGLPKRTIENSRYDAKKARDFVDLELIRLLGRELLGDVAGSKIRFDKDVPKALALWLCTTTSNNPITEYKKWNDVIIESWGKREFFEMKVDLGY